MSSEEFVFSLSGLSDRERELAASDLIRAIKESDPTSVVERRPSNAYAQDLGATIILILGTGAGIEIARGVKNWMGRWKQAALTVEDKERKIKVILENISSDEAVRLAELLTAPRRD